MAAHSFENMGPDPEPAIPASGVEHNGVLIRTHEPARETHAWAVPAVLCVAVAAGAIIWGVIATHPAGPVVNHAVASAPTSFAPSSAG